MDITHLSAPERRIWQAFTRGTWVDLREGDPAADDLAAAPQWGPERVIRAEVISALLLGARDLEPGFAPGVRLRGAKIAGRLDLMGASLAHPFVCEYCYFTEEPRFVECSAKTVRIVGSRLPGLNGTRMRVTGILNLWRSTVAGVLRLDQARVEGQLCLAEAEVGAGGGAEAVAAHGLAVDGGLECTALRAHGSVALEHAAITGTVDLSRSHIACPGGRALAMDRAVLGKLDCRGMVVAGETRMHNSRIGASMVLAGATLDNPGGVALSAGGLSAAGGLFLNESFSATGEIRLIGASLAANLTVSGAAIRNPGGTTLNLDRATLGVFRGDGLVSEGQVSLTGARVASDFDLKGARLSAGGARLALAADGASVDGALVLARMDVDGEIRLRTVQVAQRVLLLDSRLANPGRTTLRLSRAKVAADVFCDRMTSAGEVRVAGASVGGELSFKGARIRNGTGTALDAAGLDAGELSLRLAEPAEGLVDLRHARVRIFRDDPGTWPSSLSIGGMTYDALEPSISARHRLQWLARDPHGHQPQPYEQLAAHYVAVGQPAEARHVMYARERIVRHGKTLMPRTWSLLQDVTIGYGYQPWRAVAWLAVLLIAGSITFAVEPPLPFAQSNAPHFNPVIYTLDLLLPVVDLGQKHAFNPVGAEQWFSYLLMAAGWVLITTVAAGAARVLSRR